MRSLLLVATVILTFTSCSIKSLPGIYVAQEYGTLTTSLELDTNHRFELKIQEHLFGRQSKGTWSQESNILNLQSDPEVTSPAGIVTEKIEPGRKVLRINFFDFDCKHQLQKVEVTINDSVTLAADSGWLELNMTLKSLYIRFDQNRYFHYNVKNNQSNLINVCLLPFNTEIFLSNEKYRIKGKNLVDKKGLRLKRIKK